MKITSLPSAEKCPADSCYKQSFCCTLGWRHDVTCCSPSDGGDSQGWLFVLWLLDVARRLYMYVIILCISYLNFCLYMFLHMSPGCFLFFGELSLLTSTPWTETFGPPFSGLPLSRAWRQISRVPILQTLFQSLLGSLKLAAWKWTLSAMRIGSHTLDLFAMSQSPQPLCLLKSIKLANPHFSRSWLYC